MSNNHFQYIWICDEVRCGFKSTGKDHAEKHELLMKHKLTKCKNLNYTPSREST